MRNFKGEKKRVVSERNKRDKKRDNGEKKG